MHLISHIFHAIHYFCSISCVHLEFCVVLFMIYHYVSFISTAIEINMPLMSLFIYEFVCFRLVELKLMKTLSVYTLDFLDFMSVLAVCCCAHVSSVLL